MWLRLICCGVVGLLVACAPLDYWEKPATSEIARLETIRLLPVIYSTGQVFPQEQQRIDTYLRQELTMELGRKGYRVLPEAPAATADADLQVMIYNMADGRLGLDGRDYIDPLMPEIRLYARVRLARSSDGAVLLAGKTQGIGTVDYPRPFAVDTPYSQPQRDLGRRISALFPPRS